MQPQILWEVVVCARVSQVWYKVVHLVKTHVWKSDKSPSLPNIAPKIHSNLLEERINVGPKEREEDIEVWDKLQQSICGSGGMYACFSCSNGGSRRGKRMGRVIDRK